MTQETKKRIMLGANKSEAFMRLREVIRERAEAKAAGDKKRVEELDKEMLELEEEFGKRGGGRRNTLDAKPEEVLKMSPGVGDALVIVKTMNGTLCFKTHLAKDVENKRVTVGIKDIYPYPKEEEKESK